MLINTGRSWGPPQVRQTPRLWLLGAERVLFPQKTQWMFGLRGSWSGFWGFSQRAAAFSLSHSLPLSVSALSMQPTFPTAHQTPSIIIKLLPPLSPWGRSSVKEQIIYLSHSNFSQSKVALWCPESAENANPNFWWGRTGCGPRIHLSSEQRWKEAAQLHSHQSNVSLISGNRFAWWRGISQWEFQVRVGKIFWAERPCFFLSSCYHKGHSWV